MNKNYVGNEYNVIPKSLMTLYTKEHMVKSTDRVGVVTNNVYLIYMKRFQHLSDLPVDPPFKAN